MAIIYNTCMSLQKWRDDWGNIDGKDYTQWPMYTSAEEIFMSQQR